MSRIAETSMLGKVPEGAGFIGFEPIPGRAARAARARCIYCERSLDDHVAAFDCRRVVREGGGVTITEPAPGHLTVLPWPA